MRGERAHLRFWERFYGGSASGAGIPREPSPFAVWVAEQLPPHSAVVDLGSGAGRDAIFLARQGHDVVGHDYCGSALRLAEARAEEAGAEVRFQRLNVYESREVLTYAALQAHERRRTEIYSRLLVDTLRDDARSNLWTYARMVLRGGGRLYLEFTAAVEGPAAGTPGRTSEGKGAAGAEQPPRRRVDPATIVAEIEARGGLVEHRDVARGRGGLRQDENPAVCRLVVRWS
jgi:SAM-dependent methyltransferase